MSFVTIEGGKNTYVKGEWKSITGTLLGLFGYLVTSFTKGRKSNEKTQTNIFDIFAC